MDDTTVSIVTATYGRYLTCGHSVASGGTFIWNLINDTTACEACSKASKGEVT
jgi:hypothetical protein